MLHDLASFFQSDQQTQKIFFSGTHRVRLPEDTWKIINPRLAHFGITRLADVTGLDSIGIPVFMAVRPLARTLTVSQGKGATHLLAKVSAAMEAIELWHSEYAEQKIARRWSPSRAQNIPYAIASLVAQGGLVTEDTPLDWVAGRGLLSGSQIVVPAELVYYTETVDKKWAPPGLRWSSNGLASGNSLAEAWLHALYEIIERDSVSSQRVSVCPAIDPLSIDDQNCAELVAKLNLAGVQLIIYHMPSRFGIPCFGAKIWSYEFPVTCIGWGAHSSPAIALSRAITEAAQSRLTAIAGSRDDLPAVYDPIRTGSIRPPEAPSSYTPWPAAISPYDEIFQDTSAELSWLCRKVQNVTAVEPIGVDLSSDSDFSVVKVIVSGGRFDSDRVHGRAAAEPTQALPFPNE